MITRQNFGVYCGKQVEKYTLTDKISVEILTLGATIVAISVPNKQGGTTDVALSLCQANQIAQSTTYMGAVVGRCANRIANGTFTLEGKTYNLAKNDGGKNHLHGGNVGFNQKVFDAHTEGDSLYLRCVSADGEENYPGNLTFTVKYTVTGTTLCIDYFAQCDKTTVFAPTNHTYFNLDGQDAADICNNVLQIFATKFLPIDANLIPTGEERSVLGGAFDFSTPKAIGRDIASADNQLLLAGGYDHNFCLEGSHAATAFSPKTGVVLHCFTDMPGVQFYSGNFLAGEQGKSIYGKRAGFCLETQFWPNAVNMPQWKQPLLHKGENFHSQTRYIFEVQK